MQAPSTDGAGPALPREPLPGDPVATGPDGPVVAVVDRRVPGRVLAARRVAVPVGRARDALRSRCEAVAGVGHPGLVVVCDLVDVDDEVVEVREPLPTGGPPTARSAGDVRAVLRGVAGALGAAHAVGVAHGRLGVDEVGVGPAGVAVSGVGLVAGATPAADVAALGRLGLALLADVDDPPLAALCALAADDPTVTLPVVVDALATGDAPPPRGTAHPAPPGPDHGRTSGTAEEPGGGPAPRCVAPATSRRTGPGTGWRGRLPVAVAAGVLVVGVALGATTAVLDDTAATPDDTAATPDDTAGRGAPVAAARPVAACPPTDRAARPAIRRADVDGDGCDEVLRWDPERAELSWTGPDGAVRWRVGDPGDALVVGDWDCDGTATAAVVRASGETHLFDGWAGDGETLRARPGPRLPSGADPVVVADDGCDRLGAGGA